MPLSGRTHMPMGGRRGTSGLGAPVAFPLPLGGCAALVVNPHESGGKPPLDGASSGSATAPAIRVTTALAVARIVDALNNPRGHVNERTAGRSPAFRVRSRIGTCCCPRALSRGAVGAPVRPTNGGARRHRTPACLMGQRFPRRSGVGKRRRNMSSDASKATPRTSLANPSHPQAIPASMPCGVHHRPSTHAAGRVRLIAGSGAGRDASTDASGRLEPTRGGS